MRSQLAVLAAGFVGVFAVAAPAHATPNPTPETAQVAACNPAYLDVCLTGDDVDCADIPAAQKPVRLANPRVDPYRLDEDGDGLGCESGQSEQPKPTKTPGKKPTKKATKSPAAAAPAPDGRGGSEQLPVTGSTPLLMAAIGLAVAGIGAGGMVVARRRKVRFTA